MSEQQRAVAKTVLGTVQVEGGALSGVPGNDPTVTVFKGVPFAAPPVGAGRWSPPQPPAAWQGVRRADTFGPICPQFIPPRGSFYGDEFYLEEEPQSEDCLYLNIWTAATSSEERRPVMVWFHGGGFVEGSGSLSSFHGETLAKKGVVLVTVNYRLGIFGYFAHPALTADSPRHASGNYGLLDQIAALRWVQDNIAAFGGDAGNVTIFGQSAGAMSVFLLLASPLTNGLFKRVIGQSGSAFSFRSLMATLPEAEQAGVERAALWGASTLDELRALPSATLLGSTVESYRAAGSRPTLDGWSLTEDPTGVIAAGRHQPVSLLVGATADEWTPMTGGRGPSAAEFRQQAQARYGEQADAFLHLYPVESDDDTLHAQIASMSDQLFAGMRIWASRHSANGQQPAYLYYFDRKLPGRDSERYGAFHSGDLYYVFGTLDSTDRPWTEADRRLADAMTSYWTNFAATGDPNGANLPEWPAYNDQTDQVMELGEQIGAITTPKADKIAFLTDDLSERIS